MSADLKEVGFKSKVQHLPPSKVALAAAST